MNTPDLQALIELPNLPEAGYQEGLMADHPDLFTAEQMREYGKQCANHSTLTAPALPGAGGGDGWIAFSDRLPPESPALDDPSVTTTDTVLVTNNLQARDRMGRMSHVWLLSPIDAGDGEVVGFTELGAKIHALTHWKDAGIAALPPQQGG